MSKKIRIEIDESGKTEVFVGDFKIGSLYEGEGSLINSINISTTLDRAQIEIVFANLLGGLFEANHVEIGKSLRDSIRILRSFEGNPNLSIDSSIRFQLNTERLFEKRDAK